jgi:hypothetical protein
MSYLKEDDLLKAFKSYLLDIKPYHTKLDGIYAEYLFQDRFQVSILENKPIWQIYLQNVFDSDSFGGWRLYHTVDSTSAASKRFLIPQTIIPRFSLNTYAEQFPVGNNPAMEDDIPSVNEVPWATPGTQLTRQGWSYSHQEGITDELPFVPELAKVVIEITSISAIVAGAVTFTYNRHLYYDTTNAYGGNLTSPTVLKNGVAVPPTVGSPHYLHDTFLERISVVGLTKTFTALISAGKLLVNETVNGQPYQSDLSYTHLAPSIILGGNVDVPATITTITPHVMANLYDDVQGISYSFTESGRYRVPYHNGSHVAVNGVAQTFGVDYIVDGNRDAIQFLSTKHPVANDDIRINYFNVDRLFIAVANPFSINVTDGYDDRSYDMFNYDTSIETQLVYNTDYFELTVDSSLPNGYKVEFFNAVTGTIKASIQDVVIYPSANDLEVWTVTAISDKVTNVTGSINGDSGKAYYRQRYDNGKIAFTIKNTYLPYYMTPDNPTSGPDVGKTATYSDVDFNMFNVFTFGGSRDTQDYLVNLNLTSTHGISDDFNTQPTSYFDDPVDVVPFGNIIVNKDRQYFFELTDTPLLGTVIEFRVEQNTQYNTWMEVDIKEQLVINEVNLLSDYLDLVQNGYDLPDFDIQGLDVVIDRDPDGTLHNEPYQVASAGIKESLKFTINYVDATPDAIFETATIYGMKYQQTTAVNDLVLNRVPDVTINRVGSSNGYLYSPQVTTQEVWTLTATSASNFTVSGSVSGSLAAATVGTPYVNALVNFTIVAGTVAFEAGDSFVFSVPVISSVVTTSLDSGGVGIGVIVPDKIFTKSVTNESPTVVGTGNGVIKVTDVNQTTAVAEVWTITATNATNFTVSGSVSGAAPAATVGTPYVDKISFKITAGGTPFAAGATFTVTVKEDWSKIHVKFNVARTFDVYLV